MFGTKIAALEKQCQRPANTHDQPLKSKHAFGDHEDNQRHDNTQSIPPIFGAWRAAAEVSVFLNRALRPLASALRSFDYSPTRTNDATESFSERN